LGGGRNERGAGEVRKKTINKWEAELRGGRDWPKPKRISVYLFENQIKMLEQIARERGMTKRHVFFDAIQMYIGTYLGPS
jgi:hypothetical protein